MKTPRLRRLFSLHSLMPAVLALACVVLPQEANGQALPTVSIAADAASVAEDVASGNATFTVSLSEAVDSDVALNVTYAGGTTNPATPADDLGSGRRAMVTILQGQTRATITVPITDDDIVEVAETFTVSLSGTLPTGVVYATQTATATITDNDSAVISIGSTEISEGGTLAFPVSLSAPVSRAVALTASTSNGTAAAGTAPLGDYTSVTNGAITFPANSDADVVFEVQTIDDRTPESIRETLTVTLTGTGLPERVTLSPTASTATGTIVDNEGVLISIEDMQAAEGEDIAFPITFTVPLQLLTITNMTVGTTSSSDSPTIDRQTDLGNVPAGVGFVNFDGTLSDSTTYTVQTRDDNVVEGNETFIVTLGQPSTEDEGSAPRVDRRRAIGTIIDSDTATVSLASTATATEGDDTITFTVQLDNPVAEAFTLAWTATDGTATRATDFEAQGGTVEIPALSREVEFTIDITDDEAFEEEETFTVAFSGAPTGLVHVDPDRITVSQSAATATIADDDAIFVGIADAPAVREADNASAEFTATLSRAAAEDVVLNLEYTEVTATPATDLGSDRPTTVTISEGNISAPITVPIANDALVEGEETFTVALAEDSVNAPLPRGVFIEESADTATGTIADDDMATVSIAPTEASATEGNPVNFTVQLSQAVDEAVNVTWTASPGTGASPATLSGPGFDLGLNQDITGTAVVPANTTTAVDVAISTKSDGIVEGAETFTVTLTATTPLPDGVTFGTQTATATITDSDMATVSITPAEASVAEGGTFNFMVQLNQAVDEAITVTWTAAPGTGTSPATVRGAGSDLGPNQDITGTAVFQTGTTTAVNVAIVTTNDAIVEGAETFTVTLTSATPLPDGVTFGTQAATATITEDETATVSIAPAMVSEDEGDPFSFTVTLSRAAGRPVVLDVGYAPGATNPVTLATDLGSDPPDTVTIPAGDLSANLNVPIMDDDRVESDETFIVTLTAPDDLLGGVMIDDNNKSSTATIIDSDAASVSLTPASLSAAENEPFTFTVNLSAPVFEDVNLTWTARELNEDGAATISIDLAESTDTLTVPAGSTSATFTIRPVDDDLAEVDENFNVELTAVGELPDRVTLAPNARRSKAIIRDNEGDSSLIVLDVYPNNQVIRGESLRFVPSSIVTVGFNLVRGNTGNDPLIVNVVPRDGNTLTEGEDYRLLFGQIVVPAYTSTFNGFVGAQLIDDSVVEIFTESAIFDFEVVSSHDARILNGIPADFTIEDIDRTRISLSQSASAVEGDTIVFTAELDNPVARPFELTWTATDGPATGNPSPADAATVANDLEDQSGTVTVPALSRSVTISIPIVEDDALEGDENFTLTLTGTDGLDPPTDPFGIWSVRVQIDGNANSTIGTITDNDEATVSISPSRATTAEGGTFTFRVALSEPVTEDVTVDWTAAGSGGNAATLTGSGSDLADGQDISGTVTIRANTTREQTITIATRNDTRDEGSETFTVTLSEPPATPLPGGVSLGADSAVATATITDNNEATVMIGDASAAENAGPVRFTVSLSQAVSRDVMLGVTYAAGSADLATDLGTDRSATVMIAANTASATLAVPINDDAIVEGTETFTVTIAEDPDTPLPEGVSIPAVTAAGTGTITENDTATVVITQATTEAAEGTTFAFVAGLSTQVDAAVTVRWTAAPGTQTRHNPATVTGPESDLADGQSATGTVTFAANDTTPRQFTITTRNDTRDEGTEAFTVTLSADDDNPLPDGVSVPDDPTDAIITDRESGSATVSIFPPTATRAEGNSFNFEVRLSRAAEEPVTVTWTAAGSGGNAATVTGTGSDLAAGQDSTGTVTFNTGDTVAKTVTIATIDDDRVEGTETFTVSLSGTLPDGVEFATSRATATITEDETAELSITSASEAAEGSEVAFAVNLSAPSQNPVTVRWTATTAGGAGSATLEGAGSDLATGQVLTDTVEFAANDNATKTVVLATVNDDRVEGSETFTVTLSEDTIGGNLLPGGVDISDTLDAGIGTITEDDAAELSIADGSGAEGSPVVFDVSLSAASAAPVTVRWTATTAGGAGAATLQGSGSDLAPGEVLTGTVEFAADDTAVKRVSLATVDDASVEGDETFTVTLSPDTQGGNPLPDGVSISSAGAAATGTITEDETAVLSIATTATAAEGDSVEFAIDLSAASQSAVTVRWTATTAGGDGSATLEGAGSDLATGQDLTGTVEFTANDTASKTVSFATVDDARVEGSETFTVTLSEDTIGGNLLPGGVDISDTLDAGTGTITEDDAATVSLSPLSPSVAEGGTFTFTATLSASVSEAVTVRWTAASGTATVDGAGTDLASGQATTDTVTFPADSAANATQTFTIATANDARVEGSETFTVTLSPDDGTALPDGVTVGDDDEATATITETDTATVSLSPLSPSVAEGGAFTFTATLSASVSESVTVRWTAASGTATVTGAGSDLASGQATTGTVEFPANSAANATQTFTIATANDTRVEGSETFTVTLGEDTEGGNDLPDGVEIGPADEATATITETDAATVTLSPLSPSAAEGGTFTFTATLSASVSEAVTVRWTAASGTATVDGAGSDLASGQDITATVTFPADSAANATQTFTIATNNDDLVEGSETFTVTLGEDTEGGNALPDGVEIGSADEATATITETDAATVSLSPLSPSAAEGGTFTFTATLSASVSESVTVRWTAASGTATVDGAGSDLASGQDIGGTVEFPANSAANATRTFTIATANDARVEGSETFTVTLGEDTEGGNDLPDGVEIGSADEATATITETDTATVSLSPLSPSAAEGGTFTFTATLSASVSEAVTVRWTAASGTATVDGAGSDLASGQAVTATVTFPADSAANATQTFTIATANDARVEGSETFTVTLSPDDDTALPDGVTVGDDDEATATITETDTATVSLSPLSPSVAEGGTFTFTATLSASVSEAVTVRWTAASGTATVTGAGSDLASGQATTGTVEFPADSAANATQTFTIATANDARVEGSETFTVTLSPDDDNALPDGVTVGDDDEATSTITETDTATVTLSPLSPSVAEGGTFTFTATLSASVSEAVTVRWTAASGTATVTGAGSDLASGQATTATVVFPANGAANATQTFTIATANDARVEGSETFTVTLSPDDDTALPDGVTVGDDDEATATITETDAATVSLSPLSPSAAEGGTFTFTATLSASVSEAVTVRWTAASGTATVDGAGSDLASGQAATATVTFPADSAANATQTFTIATNNDARVEGSETFTVTLGEDTEGGNDLPDGVEIGSADEATATITETDTATVTLSPLSPSVAEGGTFTFTATLSASVSESVTVRWTAASGTATVDGAGSDLASGQAATATVTFPADSAANATQTFTIATNNDARVEGSETFTVTLGEDTEGGNDLPDGVEIGSADEATATITETDAATVTLSPLSPSVAEGGMFTFTATLSASVSEAVTVRWTAASGTATVDGAGSDLASGQDIGGTVEFPANSAVNATRTFTITTANDARVEGSETFTVTLGEDTEGGNDLPDGVEIGTDDEATATITEDDAAELSIADGSEAEGSPVVFEVSLSAAAMEGVTVRWTATTAGGDGAATLDGAGSDLAAGEDLTGTVVFGPNDNAVKTVSIATVDDALVEGDETFTVTLSPDTDTSLPDGVTIPTAGSAATGTITETDAATVSLSPLSPSAAEGGTFTFTATLSASVSESVTARWTATDGTASVSGAGSDLASGQATTATVVFPANGAANATRTFTIATANDARVEGSETFTVTLSPDDDTALPAGVTVGDDDEATATITETDAATVTLSPLSPSAAEGGTFTFTATLSASVSESVTVRWTAASGTATVDGAGSDLASGQATTGTVEFPADSAANATRTFTIATNNDTRVEGSETFTVTLGEDTEGGNDLPDGVEIGSADEATATITETDAATVTLSPLSPSVAEGGMFTFTATLSASVSEAVTVRWTAASGTATVDGAGSDLASGQATTDTVEFPADSAANATQTFTIATNNDTRVEGSETFTVTLSPDDDTALPDGVTVGDDDEATATITETDAATVSLSPLSPSVAEGGMFTFTATLSASVSEAVTVRWTAASGTATVDGAGSDLASGQDIGGTVEFPANSAANATQTFTIATANDARVEGSETFTVTLGEDTEGGNDLPDGVEIGTDDEATATITEDDAAELSIADGSEAEGSPVVFEVSLSAAAMEGVTVRWTATTAGGDGAATLDGAGSDLAAGEDLTGTVVFGPNDNAVKTVSIATVDDALVEGDETFTVTLSPDTDTPLPDGVTIPTAGAAATGTITETDAATVSLSPLSPSAAEGGTFTFTATLSASVSESVTARWTATDGTASVSGAGSDLASGQATTATVAFPANSAANATQTFTIATANDARVEGSETFTVTLSPDDDTALPDGVTVGSADEATATITETDAATVSLSPLSPSVAEGGTFTFTATLSASVSEAVTVRWTAASGTATVDGANSDLASGQATTATVEFPADSAANATQTFTIATNNDTRVEGSETFTVTLGEDTEGGNDLPDGVEIGSADEATATITETDAATVSLSPLSPSAAEGGTFTFTATLSASVSEAVTVRWTAASGTATVDGAGSDLASGQATTDTVEFPADSAANATQTFTIATNNDARVEGSETFTVTLGEDTEGGNALPDGVEIGSADEATATITETDAATVSLSPLSPSAAEGGTFTFTATLSASVSEAVTVRWTAASGTATVDGANSDLASGQATTDTVEFPADSAANATQTFTIATNNDARVEGSETFTVTLGEDTEGGNDLPDGVEIGSADEATATITETDAATVSLSPLSPSAAEGGTFTFTATLSASVSESVTVRWTAASGTATVDGADSDLASGQATTATVAFPANSAANATQTFTIATANDARVEGSETFTVTLSPDDDNALPDGVTVGDDDEATATITETDAATVSLSPLSPSVAEGGMFTFTATLSASVSESVTVRWTAASGTATVDGANSDLASGQATTATVEFPADSAANATQTFTIATNNDARVEGSETFTVTLGEDTEGGNALPDGVEIGSADEATATITETDAATVSLSPLSPSAAEGGTFTFTTTLSASVSESVTVRWTAASGTATVTGAGSDLASGQATTATVVFPANSAANATQTFTIATANDARVEGSETFTVTLSEDTEGGNDLPDGVEIGSADEATATITETDTATVTLSPLSPSAAEGGTFTFTATLSASVSESVTVRWTATDGTASVSGAGSDLASGQATTATVAFPANSAANATQTFTIATANDARVEGSETFTVTLSPDDDTALPDGVTVGDDDEATATITETDTATVSLSPLSPSSAEGGTFTFTATLSASVSEAVTVRWTAASGTATVAGAGSDLASGQATTATIEFPADSAANATQTFTIATANDARVEGSETFTVTLSEDTEGGNDLPDGVEIGADDEATATITEDDAAELSIADGSGAEGSPVVFEVSLSAATMEGVTVRWTATTAGGDGAATLDGAGSDLASGEDLTGTVVFGPNDNAVKTVSIATVDDALVEGDETFTVTLSPDTQGGNPLPDGVTIPSAGAAATGTITEDDMATVSIAPEADTQTEGGSFAFEVRLSAPVNEAVNVTWTAVAGTARVQDPNSDLANNQAITGTATFAPGTTTAVPIPINTLDDDVAEGEEVFTVTLTGTLPTGVDYGTQTATATITDNDDDAAPTVVASLSPLSPSVAEGGTFTFTVALSEASSSPVTVRWTAVSAIARVDGPNSDLANGQATTGTVVFQANSTASQTFTIATRNDAVAEGPETFTVGIAADPDNALPPGVIIGDDDEARATITDAADATTLTLSPSSSSRAESGTFSFSVTLNGSSSSPVTVRWRARPSGDNPARLEGARSDLADGQAIGGRLVTFPANSPPGSRRGIGIATRDDAVAEGDETFTVDILEDPARPLPTGVTIGDDNESVATITDAADAATVSIAPADASVAEGGTFNFTVNLSAPVDEAVNVTWTAVAGTAEVQGPNSDLAASQDITGTATFAAGTTTVVAVPIVTLDDDVAEGEEVFTVTLSGALPDGVDYGTQTATATITANDRARVSIAPEADSQAEGNPFAFEVRLSQAIDEAVSVTWTAVADTASVQDPNSDLAPNQDITGTATFTAGTTTAVAIPIATLDDDRVESDETFTVTLSGTLPIGVEYGTQTATATITDDDMATVSIAPEAGTQSEGGTFAFEVRLSAPVDEAISVTWTAVAGTAAVRDPDSDLVAGQGITGTVNFAVGTNTTVAIPRITTLDDDRIEGEEAFTVTLSGALPTRVEYGTQTATATITDNDGALVRIRDRTVDEGAGSATFTVTLSEAVDSAVVLDVTYTDGSAEVATDLGTPLPPTVTIDADSTEATLAVPIIDDDIVEGEETFTVTVSEPLDTPLPDGVTIADGEATGTITDNDEAPPEEDAMVRIGDRTVDEGAGSATFTVTLSEAVDSAVVLDVTYADGSAEVATDLGIPLLTTVMIAADTTEATLAVPIVDDDLVEGDETFTVTVSEPLDTPLPDGVTIADGEATGTITDNDESPPPEDDATVSLSPLAPSRAEGETFTFQVALSQASASPVTVRWTATASGIRPATLTGPSSDLETGQVTTATVTFPANSVASREFTIITRNDAVVEGAETFTVTLAEDPANPLPAGVSIGDDDEATATITEDELAMVSIAPAEVRQSEGDPFNFAVNLSAPVHEAVTVTWTATSGTARVSGDDSDLGPGQDVTGTVVFAAGTDEEQTFRIATLDDLLVEGTETFTVTLSGRLPVGVNYGTRRATATIIDDDRATVSIAPPTPRENEGGVFNFAVNLSAPVHEVVTVTWRAVSGTARVSGADSDLEAGQDVTGTVFFAAGTDEDQTFSLATLDDLLVEGDETFTVTLSGRLPMRVNYDTRTATATIVDDDRATVVLAPPTPSEDEGGVFNFTVSLSQAVAEEISVSWTATSGTARVSGDDSDLEAGQDVTGTVFFAAGTAEDQTFSIATLNDTHVEGDEDFTVTLSGDLPSGVDYGTRTAIATIIDDDFATVDIEDAPPVAEDAGPARFRVTLSRELEQDVVLDVAYVAGSAALADLGSPRPATVTIAAGGTEASLDVPIFDDELVEDEETFTVILTGDSLPTGVSVGDGVALGTIARTPEQSALIESRRSEAGTALRRHVNRFDRMTSRLVRNRLDGRRTQNLSGSKNLGDENPLSLGGGLSRGLGGTHWGTWIDGAWAGLSGTASGQQADLYGGVDYRSENGRWLIGALAGYELADLDTGGADYRADFTQIGFYGGARLSERLLLDVAATYGMATPEIALGDLSASYDARRFTARAALTGSFGLEYGLGNGSLRIEPQLGALYARETLGAFTDSAGGAAGREVLELGRFNAGPRLTWEFEGGQMVGGIRLQSDVLKLQDGVQGRFSGAADIGLRLELRPDFRMGFQLDIDGIGLKEDFGSLGGRIEFGIGFGSGPQTTQVQKRGTNEATWFDPEVPTTSDRR